jgi:NAD(P)-dependent dehydrogenase (short-subunit alcohol dehydrogenase family)
MLTPIGQLLSLEGRTAVITGGGRGIGAAMARRLLESGASVVIADRRELDDAGLAKQVAEAPERALFSAADVSSEEAVIRIAEAAIEFTGRLDIWINNAGVYPHADGVEIDLDDWDVVHAINLRAAFIGAREAARRMAGSGVIINVGSIVGERAVQGTGLHYATAKAGLHMLTRQLGLDLGPRGIRVVGIAPGFVVTPGVLENAEYGARVTTVESVTPLRTACLPDDIALATLFLASDAARTTTAEVLNVDGGLGHGIGSAAASESYARGDPA